MRNPPISPAAIATATAKAALDDRPDPTGTVDVTSASKPIAARPGRDNIRSTAAIGRPHPGSTSRGVLDAVGRHIDDPVECIGAGDDAAVGARLGADHDLAVDGQR